MRSHIIAAALNGMNRFSERDTAQAFDVKRFAHIPKTIHAEVSAVETTNSTLYYELLRIVELLRISAALAPADLQVILGRGTAGPGPRRRLRRSLVEYSRIHGKDAFKVIVGKSYGGIKTLQALREINTSAAWKQAVGTIDLLILLDSTAPPAALRPVSRDTGDGRVLVVPGIVDTTCAVFQRVDPLIHGRPASGRRTVYNWELDPSRINGRTTYAGWTDAPPRTLRVCHRDMEEILCGPGVVTRDGNRGTLETLIRDAYARHAEKNH